MRRLFGILAAFIFMNAAAVKTNAVTLDEALDWAKSQIGTYYDFDGIDGSQCFDLVMGYYDLFGEFCNDAYLNEIPPNFTKYKIEDVPGGLQPGDVFIRITERYSHVGVVISVIDNENFTAVEANQNGKNNAELGYYNTPVRRVTQEEYTLWGVLRPDFDKKPTIADAVEILKYVAGLDSVYDDVDDSPTIADAIEVLRFVAGLDGRLS